MIPRSADLASDVLGRVAGTGESRSAISLQGLDVPATVDRSMIEATAL